MGFSCGAAAVAAIALLMGSGCGYPGAPLPPLANVPSAVTDLGAVQRADIIVARFTVPYRTTELQPIRGPLKLDLRVGTAKEDFRVEEWAREAKAAPAPAPEHGIAIYRIPAADWTGKEIVIGVRAIGSNGKESGWSNYAVLRVVPTPEVPSKPALQQTPLGVHIAWSGRGDQFRILRRAANEENFIVAQTAAGHEWTDTDIENGRSYFYRMQALVSAGDRKYAESDLSDAVELTAKDTFPPAVPTGLRADPAGNSISLTWDAGAEPDLAGYRIYRSLGDGPWQKLADGSAVPSYSDNTVESGKTYRYAVSAFDKSGNESARCRPVEVTP